MICGGVTATAGINEKEIQKYGYRNKGIYKGGTDRGRKK